MQEERINDYQISKLIAYRDMLYNETNSRECGEMAYFETRAILLYVSRLLFAIGWSKLRPYADNNVNQYVYESLFKNSLKTGNSIEAGTMGHVLEESAKRLSREKDVAIECKILVDLGFARNIDAHEIHRVNKVEFVKQSESILNRFKEMFSGRICTYLVPTGISKSNEIVCKQFTYGCTFPETVYLPIDTFQWSEKGNHVFYSVTDISTAKIDYYSLSPFIEAPTFLSAYDPNFLYFDSVKNSGYGTEYDTLRYYAVIPDNYQRKVIDGKEEQIPKFSVVQSDYLRAELFSQSLSRERESLWNCSSHGDKDVFINVSSYPGFGEVLNNRHKYCKDICPIRQNVIDFCKDTNKQVALISGNGGVGKTALMLSVISELLMNKAVYHYTNLIFLSAKKYIFEKTGLIYSLTDYNQDADIHSFDELMLKMMELLSIPSEKPDASLLVKTINGMGGFETTGKRFLLVIDDLDSLSIPDQKSIFEFAYKLNSQVIKTIITTRSVVEESPVNFQLGALSDNASEKYAQWYAEEMLMIPSWSQWQRRKDALEWIRSCGEGNPLNIQMLLTLIKAGQEAIYNSPSTKEERTLYFYKTVQNLLDDEEKTVFAVCCKLYGALSEEYNNREMMLSVLNYLVAGVDISGEACQKAIRKLKNLKLLSLSKNQLQFKPYTNVFMINTIFQIDLAELPAVYQYIWQDVSRNPEAWLTIHDIETIIVNYIISLEGKRNFSNIVARKILERILEGDQASEKLKQRIQVWFSEHSTDSQSEVQIRLIQQIESSWEKLKCLFLNGDDDEALIVQLLDSCQSLAQSLKETPDEMIEKRLNIIKNESADLL